MNTNGQTASPLFTPISKCRLCGMDSLEAVIDLGDQPPANSLRTSPAEKPTCFPLELLFCSHCSSTQLSVTVNPDYLFSNYVWVSGTSETTVKYSNLFHNECYSRLTQPNKPQFVVEVASNDGTFLQPFASKGNAVLGIDPAKNIAEIANHKGIETIPSFFSASLAEEIVKDRGHTDVVIARNVLPHVEDVNDVVSGISALLKNDGIGVIEFHYAGIIVRELHYDSIYHEHLLYLTLDVAETLLKKHGLHVFDILDSPISGGSKVLFFSKQNRLDSQILSNNRQSEERLKINKLSTWKQFGSHCFEHRDQLIKRLESSRQSGKRIVGYGASARGATMLSFCGINEAHLSAIADANPIKHNKYSPLANIPIDSPEHIFSTPPDEILLLAWNFKDEILRFLKEKTTFQGDVIITLPHPFRVISLKKD